MRHGIKARQRPKKFVYKSANIMDFADYLMKQRKLLRWLLRASDLPGAIDVPLTLILLFMPPDSMMGQSCQAQTDEPLSI